MSNRDDNAVKDSNAELFAEIHAALSAQLRAGMGFLAPVDDPEDATLEVATLVALLEGLAPASDCVPDVAVDSHILHDSDGLAARVIELEKELAQERETRTALEAQIADHPAAAEPATATVAEPSAEGMRVLIRQLRDIELEVNLAKSELSIGRTSSNDLQFKDPSVSRLHALLVQSDGVAEIVDCDSRNGVYVNDSRVSRQQLCHGDRVMIGTQRFIFVSR